MTRKLLHFAGISVLGTLITACGLLLTGNVIVQQLVPHPSFVPGLIYQDPPGYWDEVRSGRPLWLTSAVLALMLCSAGATLARRGIGKWSISFGLCNPITLIFGWVLFFLTPWYPYAHPAYQLPLNPWIPLTVWVAVFLAGIAAQRSTTRKAT